MHTSKLKPKIKNQITNIIGGRDNYIRLRKIFLHVIHFRFIEALRIANHYNPVRRLLLLTPFRLNRMQKKILKYVMQDVFSYRNDIGKPLQIGLVLTEGNYSPKSSAFIRLIAPLTRPSVAKKVNIHLIDADRAKASPKIDVYIVQRTAFSSLRRAQKFFKSMAVNGSKLVIDNDDAFAHIPKTHPEHKKHSRLLAAKNYLIDRSDELWLSVENLIPKEYKNKSFVIKNSLDDRLWASPNLKSHGKVEMVYMGTATHDEDLRMMLPALDKVYVEHPGSFRLTTIGVSSDVPQRPWIRQLTQPQFGSLYPSFVEWFIGLGPFDIGLSPLVDNDFNKAKSDIKCLDYLAAGILPVASDLKPYQSKEIEPYIIKVKNNTADWTRELAGIVSSPDEFRAGKAKIISEAQKYIWQNRSSEKTAKVLLDRLEKLASSK